MNVLKVDSIKKSFEHQLVFEDVSFTLDKGQSLAVIGEASAGKTVLLKCLAGLYNVDQGEIDFQNKPLQYKNNNIGMLFQRNALFDSLTVWENIAFKLMVDGVTRQKARLAVEDLLPKIGLSIENAILFPSDLSGGMQKRVGLARAIISKPDILLLDNPAAGLDPVLATRIQNLITDLAYETGTTVVSVTGDIKNVEKYYNKIALLHEGSLQWCGKASDAKGTKNELLHCMLGMTPSNLRKQSAEI